MICMCTGARFFLCKCLCKTCCKVYLYWNRDNLVPCDITGDILQFAHSNMEVTYQPNILPWLKRLNFGCVTARLVCIILNSYTWFTLAVGVDNNVKPALVAPVCPPKAVRCAKGNEFDKICCEKRRNQRKRRKLGKFKSYSRKG